MTLCYEIVPVTQFAQNCSLLQCKQTNEIAIVDPGGDIEKLNAAIDKLGGALTQVLVTHAHIDHAGAVAALAKQHGVPIVGPHKGDQFWIDGLPKQSAMFGFPPAETFEPTRWLSDGDEVTLGDETLLVRHCPGHTPGHVIFYSGSSRLAIVGDVLFAGSIGRTDFPGGNHQELIDSITQKLWPLGNETEFIPGHGPNSTFGVERERNPFVGDRALG